MLCWPARGQYRGPSSFAASLHLVPDRVRTSEHDHAADALAGAHQVECPVDLIKRHRVRDHRIDLDLAFHVPVHDLGHVRASSRTPEGGAAPDPPGNELERPGGNLLSGARNPDDDALAPAAVAGFQRLAHHRHVAGAIECIVGAADLVGTAFGHVDQIGDELATDLLRVDEMGHPEAFAPRLALRIDVDPDDHVGGGEPKPLDDIEADAAKAEHDAGGASFNFGCVEDGADPGRHPAADVADLVKRCVGADFRDRNLG